MKFFRLKDPKTGLYYCPCREIQVTFPDGTKGYVKSNLSKKGKIYNKIYNNNERSIEDHTDFYKPYNQYKPVMRTVIFEVEHIN